MELTDTQLYELDKEFEKYKTTRFNKYFNCDVTTIDFQKWLKDKGAISSNGSVVVTGYMKAEYGNDGSITSPKRYDAIKYVELSNTIDQYLTWKGKKEFGARERMKQMQEAASKLAGEMATTV